MLSVILEEKSDIFWLEDGLIPWLPLDAVFTQPVRVLGWLEVEIESNCILTQGQTSIHAGMWDDHDAARASLSGYLQIYVDDHKIVEDSDALAVWLNKVQVWPCGDPQYVRGIASLSSRFKPSKDADFFSFAVKENGVWRPSYYEEFENWFSTEKLEKELNG